MRCKALDGQDIYSGVYIAPLVSPRNSFHWINIPNIYLDIAYRYFVYTCPSLPIAGVGKQRRTKTVSW